MARRIPAKSLLIVATLLSSVAQVASAQGRRMAPEAIARAIDSLAARIVAEGLTPALGVALVVDGRTYLTKAHGMADVSNRIRADERTLWYVASTSKALTGFGIALLAHQGALSLDAPITSLVPRARWHPTVDASRLTLARFLSHTHYLDDNAVVMSAAFTGAIPESQWPALVRFATPRADQDLVYSNFGYNVAAMAIDQLRPEGWRRYLDSAVYRPAGMTETYARLSGLDPRRIATTHNLRADGSYETTKFLKTDATMNSAGGHVATLRDLARWITVQMDSGVIDGRRVFPAEAVALSHRLIARQTRDNAKRFAFFDREGWSAGWDIGTYEGEPMVSRFGSYASTRSHASFLPRRRIGVVAQVNGRLGWTATDIVAAFAYDLDAGKPNAREVAEERLQALLRTRANALRQVAATDSVMAARQQPLRRPLADFAGSYFNEQFGTISFEVRGNGLHYQWGVLSAPATVFDATKDQLRVEAGGGQIVTFAFPQAGRAVAVTIGAETFTRR